MKKFFRSGLAAMAALMGMTGSEVVQTEAPWVIALRSKMDKSWKASDTAARFERNKSERVERRAKQRENEVRLAKANAKTLVRFPAKVASKAPRYVAPPFHARVHA